ncbi:MAG TPA: hypothetical protein VLT47_08135 [Anaeromyxobacteraceae bacterium]|nr:hypothetical protein [Anaeromyxobacteraceae bacterium]
MTTKIHALALCLAAALASACTFTIDPEKYAPKSAADCPGQKACGYKCVPADDPATGCGTPSCDPCPGAANAITTCGDTGACALQCNLGWGDCDAAVGCETKLDGTNPANPSCGACGRTCLGSACDPAGFCPPSYAVAGSTVGAVRALASDVINPSIVFAAVDALTPAASLWQATFTATSTSASPISSQVTTPIQCLSHGTSRLFYGADDAGAGKATVSSVPDTSTGVAPTWSGITAPTMGPCLLAPESQTAVWWIPAGGQELWGFTYDAANGSVVQSAQMPPGTLVGRWRALTVLGGGTAAKDVFVADDAEGGRILRLPPDPISPLLPQQVATGAGQVGALAVRQNSLGRVEVYWGDLATGNVIRQVDGARTIVHRGSGPTSRMRVVANALLVAWLDTDAMTVHELIPPDTTPNGAVILLSRASGLADLAASTERVFWSRSGDAAVYSAPR